MASLFHTLSIGSEALYANRQGVDTAGHNIANAQTEGFSRQRVNVKSRLPTESRGIIMGNGAYADNISRAHDAFNEKQLNKAKQTGSQSQTKFEALSDIEQVFNTELSANISDEITNFFNALQQLSANPDDIPSRTNVKEAAVTMTGAFRRVDNDLRSLRFNLDERVIDEAQQITALTRDIAKLNTSIQSLEAGQNQQANDLRDQQDGLLRTLSEKIDLNYYRNEHGALVVRGPDQVLLVDGKYASQVATFRDTETGVSRIEIYDHEGKSPREITDSVQSGSLKALMDVRDETLSNLIHKNNELAVGLSQEFNKIHHQGFGVGDFQSTTGRDFFVLPDRFDTAARDLKVSDLIVSDPSAISVAATPASPGDNILVNEMLRLKSSDVMGGGLMSFHDFYADTVSGLGLEVQRSNATHEADKIIVADLERQRESVSGVSLDEEAVNLLRWQTAFAASSKVITTVDEMLDTVLSLKR